MSTSERYQRGAEMMKEVYGDLVPAAPEGANAFMDVMVSQVFAEVWSRDGLSIRDRRLLVMGVIAASGEPSVWGIQARAALLNDELDADQLREAVIQLAQYAGYPKVSGLVAATEQAIADIEKRKAEEG
ncbi:MAG: carboxymuconolactone decarboxylase family protein [Myxococcota bacterium]|nr:carboxymuconolactone decarboxylase family protein [Myxococcota bacterium]